MLLGNFFKKIFYFMVGISIENNFFFVCTTNGRMRRSIRKYATHVMNILKYKINERFIIRNGGEKKIYQRLII